MKLLTIMEAYHVQGPPFRPVSDPAVRGYLACILNLRDLEEMMAERALSVDHSTVHRWIIHYSSKLLDCFDRRKRVVTGK